MYLNTLSCCYLYFRKLSIHLLSLPFITQKISLQFLYFLWELRKVYSSWRVRKVHCYPSPRWRRLPVLTDICGLLFFLGSWSLAPPNPCASGWAIRLVPIRANMPHLKAVASSRVPFGPPLAKWRIFHSLRKRGNRQREWVWIPKWLCGTEPFCNLAWDCDRNENQLLLR